MSQSVIKNTTALLLALHLYTSLLIGGGRGPFSLYSDYWSCHCNDYALHSDGKNDDPVLTGIRSRTLLILNHTKEENSPAGIFSEDEIESVLSDLRSASDAKNDDICRKKLPLRYISLLLGNSFACIPPAAAGFTLPDKVILSVIASDNNLTAPGFPFPSVRPPCLS